MILSFMNCTKEHKKDGMEISRNLLPELVRGVRATSGTGFSRLPCDFLSTLLFLPPPVLPSTKDSIDLIHGQPPFLIKI
jgi:hypothetical protein